MTANKYKPGEKVCDNPSYAPVKTAFRYLFFLPRYAPQVLTQFYVYECFKSKISINKLRSSRQACLRNGTRTDRRVSLKYAGKSGRERLPRPSAGCFGSCKIAKLEIPSKEKKNFSSFFREIDPDNRRGAAGAADYRRRRSRRPSPSPLKVDFQL